MHSWFSRDLLCKLLHSVLWRCWLGGRKVMRPVKTEWWGAGVVICLECGADLHMVQLLPLSLASYKSRLVLPFWYRLTEVVVEKRPLNGCSVVVVVIVWNNCLRCAMALVHSRIGRVFYVSDTADGALRTNYKLHTLTALNHRFDVYHCLMPEPDSFTLPTVS